MTNQVIYQRGYRSQALFAHTNQRRRMLLNGRSAMMGITIRLNDRSHMAEWQTGEWVTDPDLEYDDGVDEEEQVSADMATEGMGNANG